MTDKKLNVFSWISLLLVLLPLLIMIVFNLFVTDVQDFLWLVDLSIFILILSFIFALTSIVSISLNLKSQYGYIYSIGTLLLIPIMFYVVLGFFGNKNREYTAKTYQGEHLSEKLVQYAKSNKGFFPDAGNWCDVLMAFDADLSEQAFRYSDSLCNYAMNKNLSKVNIYDIDEPAVIVFESEGNWNLNGDRTLLQKAPENRKYVYVYFSTGKIKSYNTETIRDKARILNKWKPQRK